LSSLIKENNTSAHAEKDLSAMSVLADEVQAIQKFKKIEVAPTPQEPKPSTPPVRVEPLKLPDVPPRKVETLRPEPPAPKPAPKTEFSTLRRGHFAAAQKPKVEPKIFFEAMKVRALPKGKFTGVFVDLTPDTKGMMIFEECKEVVELIPKLEAAIAEAVANDDKKPYSPEPNEMVLASFEGNFYRALCENVVDGLYSVYFIDYGNSSPVAAKDIRPLSKKLAEFEVHVHACYFANQPDEMTPEFEEFVSRGIPINNAVPQDGGFYEAVIEGI
jgi:Tudor domain